MEPPGSLLHRKPSSAPPPSSAAFSFPSSSSASPGEMDELPFSLEDLPPEIRNKIDDIIDKNEDLESQLEAIDELLFADRLFSKFESGTKYDIGSESGIGSDSDSGNSWASSTLFRPPGEDAVIDPRTFGPLPLRSAPLHRFHRSQASNLSPTVGHLQSSQSKPTVTNGDGKSSTPLGSGALLGCKESRDEGVRIARTTGDSCFESLDVPPEFRSTPSPDPSQERNSNASRTLATKWEGKNNNSGPAASRILKNNNRISMNVAAELSSLPSNTRQKAASLSRSSSRTELYAWADAPNLPTSSQSVVRPSKPISSEKSGSATDSDVWRSSQPNLETSRKSKLFLRKDETESSVGGRNVHPKALNGSAVDLRRNKWSSVSEFLWKGNSETTGGRYDSSDDEGSDLEYVGDAKKEASPVEDNFSNLVRLREKNGKPPQMARINQRTLKAQSMLSLYDPSSDAKEKSKVKKSNKKETGGASDSRKRLSVFLQRKLRFNKKSNDGTTSHERADLTNGVISKADSEVEGLHRSDYLSPNIPSVPARCSSIPSPSLYSSMDNKNGNNPKMRSRSEGPGHFSEIFRVYSRDLSIDDDRPRLTFDTFRGQIEPIRWRDEKTSVSETNRRNNASTTTNEPSLVGLPPLALNMSASNGNNPLHLSANNCLHRPIDHLPVQNSRSERFDERHSTNNREQQSDNSVVKGLPTATLPVIKPAMLPVSKPRRSQGNIAAGRSVASGASGSAQATLANGISSPSSANGLGDSADRRRMPPSEPQSGISNTENGHSSGHQRGILKHQTTTTSSDAVLSTSNSLPNNEKTKKSNGNNGNNESRSHSEEQRVLQTTYDDSASACDRAVSDARLTLSGLLADRERILSAASHPPPGSSSSVAPYRTTKELLASHCRQLVTDVKLMVTGATRSRPDLIGALTAAMHTFARVFEACRLTVEVMPTADGGGRRRRALLDEVLKLGDVFLDTLAAGSAAAGRGQNDPAMDVLMYHTTEMAHSLGRLLNTIKSLDGLNC